MRPPLVTLAALASGLASLLGAGRVSYTLSVEAGVLTSSRSEVY